MIQNKDKIIVTGANGFTGRFVCDELCKRNLNFCVVLRPGKNIDWMKKNKIKVLFADVNDQSSFTKTLKGFDYLINITSLGFGSAESIVESCENAGIKRAVFVSSTSIFTSLNAKSKDIRKKAEDKISNSNLKWTILRPTMIYGTQNDRNLIRLIKWIYKFPILPIFGNGESLQQPIFVKDVAWAISAVLFNEKTFYNAYNISGKNPLKFNEVVDLVSKNLDKNIIRIHLPYRFVYFILRFLEILSLNMPIKSEQILRLNENKSFSYLKAKNHFSFKPLSFEHGIAKEIKLFKRNLKKSNINKLL